NLLGEAIRRQPAPEEIAPRPQGPHLRIGWRVARRSGAYPDRAPPSDQRFQTQLASSRWIGRHAHDRDRVSRGIRMGTGSSLIEGARAPSTGGDGRVNRHHCLIPRAFAPQPPAFPPPQLARVAVALPHQHGQNAFEFPTGAPALVRWPLPPPPGTRAVWRSRGRDRCRPWAPDTPP